MRFPTLLPLLLFALVGAALAIGLTLNPRAIPSALIGHPAPDFALPPLEPGAPGLSTAALRRGEPTIVNVFASWCGPCRAEHPLLMELARHDVAPIYGLNYKDDPEAARAFLAGLGNPYARIGADRTGRAGVEWGVYGVPETFVIGGDGTILHKHVGPLTPEAVRNEILPRIAAEKRQAQTGTAAPAQTGMP